VAVARVAMRIDTRRIDTRLPLLQMVLIAAVGAVCAMVRPDLAAASTPGRALSMISGGYYMGAAFGGASADGGRVFFETSATLTSDDTDSAIDVYMSAAGQVRSVSPTGPNGWHAAFAGATPDGLTAFFTTNDALVPEDTDSNTDIYRWTDDGAITRITAGGLGAGYRGASNDGTRVLFSTVASLRPEDTDSAVDLYLWHDGVTSLVSGSTPGGLAADASVSFEAMSADGSTVLFRSSVALVGGAPDDGALYEWRTNGTLRVRVADAEVGVRELSGDGRVVAFHTRLPLVDGDTDGEWDLYIDDGTFHLLTSGTAPNEISFDDLITGFDTWVTFDTADPLTAGDTDGKVDTYRWTKSTGTIELLTPWVGAYDVRWQGGTSTGPFAVRTIGSLVASDTDGVEDLYLIDPSGPSVHLASSGLPDDAATFKALSATGDRLLFESRAEVLPGDEDGGKLDLFEYLPGTDERRSIGGSSSNWDIRFDHASTDGELVSFTTRSALIPSDPPLTWDVYRSSADTVPPVTKSSQIDPTYSNTDAVTLAFSSPDGVRYECRVDGSAWVDCASPWHKTGITTDGHHIAEVRAWDRAGNVDPTPESQGWWVDRTPPSGTVTINGGAAKAGRALVRVDVAATDMVTIAKVRLSNSPAMTADACGPGCPLLAASYEAQYPFLGSHEVSFELNRLAWGGTDVDGPHVVYVQWQDVLGNWSAVSSDTITLDRSVKVPTTVTVVGLTNPVAVGAGSFIQVTVTAADGVPVDGGTLDLFGGGIDLTNLHIGGGVFSHWQPAWAPAGAHVVTASFHGSSTLAPSSGTVTQIVGDDRIAPTVTAPVNRLQVGLRSSPSTIPVSLSWTGSDPVPGFGIARYDLRQSTDGRPWTVVSTTLMRPSLTRSLAGGHTYRFAIRAFDRAGNVSAWSFGTPFRLTTASESSSSITYRGTWVAQSSSMYFGGKVRYATTAGRTATFRAYGKQIAWMAASGPTRGWARVYIDGTYVRALNLYSRTTTSRQLMFVRSWSTPGTHTMTIKVVGTPGHSRVDVDGFITIK
jgi:hypothetical protein